MTYTTSVCKAFNYIDYFVKCLGGVDVTQHHIEIFARILVEQHIIQSN